jgi:DNA-binding winged helix-turn-helix (wHTH) protein
MDEKRFCTAVIMSTTHQSSSSLTSEELTALCATRFRLGECVVDPDKGLILRDGQSHRLQSLQMRVLCFLCQNSDRDVDREELGQAVWGAQHVSDQSVQNAVSAIRRGLNDSHLSPSYIATTRNRGYRIIADIEALNVRRESAFAGFCVEHRYKIIAATAGLVAIIGLWSMRNGSEWNDLARFLQDNPGRWDVIVSDENDETDS